MVDLPAGLEHLHGAQAALALAAVPHDVDAGALQGLEHRLVGVDAHLRVEPGDPHDELLGRPGPAVAEGLEAQARRRQCVVDPAAPQRIHQPDRAAHVHLGPSSGLVLRDVVDHRVDVQRSALVVDVEVEPLAVLLGQPVDVRHDGAGAADVAQLVVDPALAQHRGHRQQGRDADAARHQDVAGGPDPEREVLQRLGHLDPVAHLQRVHVARPAPRGRSQLDAEREAAAVVLGADDGVGAGDGLCAQRQAYVDVRAGAGVLGALGLQDDALHVVSRRRSLDDDALLPRRVVVGGHALSPPRPRGRPRRHGPRRRASCRGCDAPTCHRRRC